MGQYQNKNYGRAKNPSGKKQQTKKPSMSELATEVKEKYFPGNLFPQLLRIHNNNSDDIENLDLDKIIDAFEEFVKDFAKGVTTSQIRNVYAKTIKVKTVMDLKLLRPNLAYVAARQDNINAKKMMAFTDDLIKHINDERDVKSFHKIMETIVAYHKYYGDK